MGGRHPHIWEAGVSRELYLCDDGKDPTKRVWLETNYGDSSGNVVKGKVHYVSGRSGIAVGEAALC